jgi:putative ABC transport system permease protein
MLKNYFKIAFRTLWRSKGFSAINITGLAIGIASAFLILLWIQNEMSYDRFHTNKDRIYEMWTNWIVNGNVLGSSNTTPKVLAKTLEHDLPEVKYAVRVDWTNSILFSVGDKRLTVRGNTVDSGFLQVFSFPLLKGNPATALNDMHSIVITDNLAKKLFGDENAMGKVVKLNNRDNFVVTGVAKDLPNNTRFDFEFLIPWSYLRKNAGDDQDWGNGSTRTYVMLKPNSTFASIEPKIRALRSRYVSDISKNSELFMYPISRWRLYSNFSNKVESGGRITFVRLFGLIAGFILLIACINFMNLSTARSEKRAKEVGIRKVVGAIRISLIGQFIGESILLAFIAAGLAICLVQIALPGFNALTDKKLFIDIQNGDTWLAGIGFVLFTGILAGSYPAFFLSSFRPAAVLKGIFKQAQSFISPRKVLVVLQFTFAIILIVCSIIVKQQINYAQQREMGYNKSNLIYHYISGDLQKNYVLLKNELLSSGVAVSVSKTSAPLTENWSSNVTYEWQGKDPKDITEFNTYFADEDLGTTAGLQFVEGRDFNLTRFPSDSTAFLINESAVKAMHFKVPIGQIIKFNGVSWHVVGVIKDFIMESPYQAISPMIIGGGKGWFNVIHIKLNPGNRTADNLKIAETIFKKYNPEYPFEYHFIDSEYAKKFEDEKRTGTLAALFASLTIFISCLGLFGLAAYMAENRFKEIGVRKILGASVGSIATLLSKDFLKLVFLSFLIASPLAWWLMYKWLQDYPYRINIQWWVFAVTAFLSLFIAVITISFQAIKAAVASPAAALRSE